MKIELREVSKSFGPVVANSRISLTVESGQILGLLGENGAGKTTLMNILTGLHQPDSGQILIDGKKIKFANPGDSIKKGVGMVHQHFMLVPVFSVSENVVLGNEPVSFLNHIDLKTAHKKVREISAKYHLNVNPKELVETLPVGVQQRVEIIKVLFREAKLLIFDEPTAVLTPQEVSEFFRIINNLKTAGKAVIFITHKLHEVLEVCNKISVLRKGAVVGEANPKTVTKSKLAELMVGRPVKLKSRQKKIKPGKVILDVKKLEILSNKKERAVSNINLRLHEREILGIAGVQGNGQTEFIEALTGLREVNNGTISFFGKSYKNMNPRKIHKIGVRHIPEDRQKQGLVNDFSLAENIILNTYYKKRLSNKFYLDWGKAHIEAEGIVDHFDIRTNSVSLSAETLSGGNQQKLIVGREMSSKVGLLIASQPTRGVDVGSIEYIHQQIILAKESGTGILLESTELEEIIALSDRIVVFYQGEIVREFTSGADRKAIGLAMAGII